MKRSMLMVFIGMLLLSGCGNGEEYKSEFIGWNSYPAKDIIELAEKKSCGQGLQNGTGIHFRNKETEEWFRKSVYIRITNEEKEAKIAYGVYEKSYVKKEKSNDLEEEDKKILEETEEEIYFKYVDGVYYDSKGEVIQELEHFIFYFQYSDMSVNYYESPQYSKRSNTGDYYVEGMMAPQYTKGFLEVTKKFHQYDLSEYENSLVYMNSHVGGGISSHTGLDDKNGQQKLPYFNHSSSCIDRDEEFKEAYEAGGIKNAE